MKDTPTVFVRLRNSYETSQVIGDLAAQERSAYNQAVNFLNREPNIPMRANKTATSRSPLWLKTRPSRSDTRRAPGVTPEGQAPEGKARRPRSREQTACRQRQDVPGNRVAEGV